MGDLVEKYIDGLGYQDIADFTEDIDCSKVIQLRIVGRLIDGRYFYGDTTVRIIASK